MDPAPPPPPPPPQRRPAHTGCAHWIRRLLRLRPGEGGITLVCAAYFFCLLFSYFLMRPLRETAGISGGIESLPGLFLLTMAAMIVINPLFAMAVATMPRRRFIPLTYRVFALCAVGFAICFFALDGDAQRTSGRVFYVWLSVFNLFVVSVFWAFMTDIWRPEQSKRLFGLIGVGGTLGALAGSGLVTVLSGAMHKGWFLVLAAILLELACQCVRLVAQRCHDDKCHDEPDSDQPDAINAQIDTPCALEHNPEPGPGTLGGFVLLVKSPYLLTIAAYVALFATLSTVLYFVQGAIVADRFADDADRQSFFALLDLATQTVTVLTQILLTGRLIRWLGLGITLAILPIISLVGFTALGMVLSSSSAGLLASQGVLWTFFAFQVVRRGVNYAVAKPSREVLYTAISQPQRYGSKPIIDTIVYRASDAAGALGFPVLTKGLTAPVVIAGLGLSLSSVALLMVPVAGLWMTAGLALGMMHRSRTQATPSNGPRQPQ